MKQFGGTFYILLLINSGTTIVLRKNVLQICDANILVFLCLKETVENWNIPPMETTPYLSLTQATKVVKASKPTILKAIRSGVLPFKGKTPNGGYEIDPSDLLACFPARKETTKPNTSKNRNIPLKNDIETAVEIIRLKTELKNMEDALQRAEKQHARQIEEYKETIAHERRNVEKWQATAETHTKQIQHMQADKTVAINRGFWTKLFGRNDR